MRDSGFSDSDSGKMMLIETKDLPHPGKSSDSVRDFEMFIQLQRIDELC